MCAKTYVHDFNAGPGGWCAHGGNFTGMEPLAIDDGVAVSHSPWWVDYNHAPPGGAGHLFVLFGLNTRGPLTEQVRDYGGENHFINGGFPTDFTNARMTVRIKGEVLLMGAQLMLLIQGAAAGICSGWALTGQPIAITADWSSQTITAAPDPAQWTCLGARLSRADMYGRIDLPRILANVNVNIYLILFPIDVVPMGPIAGDRNELRAGRDYPVWQSKLPDGYVMLDSVKIEFP